LNEHEADGARLEMAGTPQEKVKNNPTQGRRLSAAKMGGFDQAKSASYQ
jgi:hypothetical protein